MKVSSVFILLLFSICTLFSQNIDFNEELISNKAKKIVKKIEEYNQITSSHIYYEGRPSKQWSNYKDLKKVTKQDELIELMKYPNNVVKGYTFMILLDDEEVDIYSILLQNLNNYNLIESQSGCIGYSQMTSDFFIMEAFGSNRLSKEQKTEIRNKILYENLELDSKDGFLADLEPINSLYEQTKEIAVKDKNKYAVYALSKYQKQYDKDLIKELLESKNNKFWGMKSVIRFPDPEFYPLVEKYLKKEIKKRTGYSYTTYRAMYQAIVQYNNQESVDLLEYSLNKSHRNAREYQQKFIWMALEIYPKEIYKDIKERVNREIDKDPIFDKSELRVD